LTPRLIGKCTQRKHAKTWSIDCVFHEVNHHCIIKAMLIFNSVLGFRSVGGSLWRNRRGKLPWAFLPITWLRFNFLVLKTRFMPWICHLCHEDCNVHFVYIWDLPIMGHIRTPRELEPTRPLCLTSITTSSSRSCQTWFQSDYKK